MSRALAVATLAVTVFSLSPAVAQEEGNLAGIVFWSIEDGATDDFEAGLKAHNQFHADHGDPVAIQTWQYISGPRQGQYGRGSFGHKWADFDQDEELLKADTADSAATITPHIAAAESTIWVMLPELSNPRQSPGSISRIIEFRVVPGHIQQFEAAVGKFHAAFSKHEGWPAYEWYALVDGGYSPTYAVVLPRDSWAGFAPGDTSFMEAMSAEYGEMTGEIMRSFGSAIKSQMNAMAVSRLDLSYFPEGGD